MAAPASDDRQMLPSKDLAFWGCALAIATGLAMGIFGLYLLFTGGGPAPFRVALIVLGISNTLLGYKALFRSRVAWSFVTASCGTLALICLFGAPKFRDLTDFSLAASSIPFDVFAVTTVLLAFRQGND